ncbi:MAG: type II secretion system F family protein [Phycisphaeraceae bacterium]|nr:MAG: type II secretion system F family protein [Phycisphaeraceae bacterium]
MTRAVSRSFVFLAAKQGGGRSLGVKHARSERALAETLRRDRMVLLRTWKLPGWVSTEAPFKTKDMLALNEQLGQLLARGVPLVESLEVAESVVRPQQRPRIERMREAVAAGSSFADACRAAGGFDVVTIAVYRAAERTGDLAGAAAQLAETARRQMKIAGKALTLLLYPMIVLSIGVIAGTFLLTTIVPTIGGALSDALGADKIPLYTKITMSVGLFLRGHWLIVLAVIVGLVIVLGLGRAVVARAVGRVARVVPILKDVILTQESARFFTVMAALSRSGVPLADGLGVATNAINHPTLRKQLERLRIKLVEGGVLPRLVDSVDALPIATRRLLIAADRAGDLDSAFDGLARDMGDRLEAQTQRLMAALEPLLIVLLFIMIGSLVLSIMIPMITMSTRVMG